MKSRLVYIIIFNLISTILLPVIMSNSIIDDHIDQQQTDCDWIYWGTYYPGKMAQSFMPTLNVLTRVKLFGLHNESQPTTQFPMPTSP